MIEAAAGLVADAVILRSIILPVLLPMATSGLVLLMAMRPWRREAPPAPRPWAAALAIGAAYAVGHVTILGLPPRPPIADGWWLYPVEAWLFWLVLAATVVGVVLALAPPRPWVSSLAFAPLAGASAALLLSPIVRSQWTPAQSAGALAGLTTAWVLLHASLEKMAERAGAVVAALCLAIVAGATGVTLLISATASGAQLAGALAAALGAVVLVGWWRPDLSFARGAAPVVAVALGGLLIYGVFYAQMPKSSAALMVAAPASGFLIVSKRRQRDKQVVETIIRLGSVALTAAAAVLMAYLQNRSADMEYGGY